MSTKNNCLNKLFLCCFYTDHDKLFSTTHPDGSISALSLLGGGGDCLSSEEGELSRSLSPSLPLSSFEMLVLLSSGLVDSDPVRLADYMRRETTH